MINILELDDTELIKEIIKLDNSTLGDCFLDILHRIDPSIWCISERSGKDVYTIIWRFRAKIWKTYYQIDIDASPLIISNVNTYSCDGNKCRKYVNPNPFSWCTACHGEPEENTYRVYKSEHPIDKLSDIPKKAKILSIIREKEEDNEL